ncbi:MAG: lanthionine synthetase LanC family protein [Pseudomonadota bacterium]
MSSGYASGLAGEAIFFAAASSMDIDREETRKAAIERLTEVQARLPGIDFPNCGIANGLAGISFSVSEVGSLLQIPSFVHQDAHIDVYEYVSDHLGLRLAKQGGDEEFDIINGLAGIGLWALSIPSEKWRTLIAAQVVDCLSDLRDVTSSSALWKTPDARLKLSRPNEHVDVELNLGAAHGAPGVCIFLKSALAQGIAEKRSKTLLVDALESIAGELHPDRVSASRNFVGDDGISRLAWCYGDGGMALAFAPSTEADFHTPRTASAWDVVRSRFIERESDSAGLMDGGVCHGSAGLLIIANRLAHSTHATEFSQARDRWLLDLLSRKSLAAGTGAFFAWNAIDRAYEWNRTLLAGEAGIGLALLTALGASDRWAAPLLGV